MAEVEKAGGQAGATTMVGATISKDIRNRCTSNSSTSTSHPRRCHNSRTHGNSSSSSSTSRTFSQGPHHHQPNPWSSWGRPPHQQQRGRAHHQRTPRHRGGHQAHQQRVMCTQCGKEEHFPADCVIAMPAPAPQYTAPFSGARPAQFSTGAHAAQQYSTGAHVAQYGTHPLPTWTPSDSDNQSTHSAYGPPSNQASFAPAQLMLPPPPISVGRHLHRSLLRILIGASLPDHPKLYRHNTCLQASFRVRV